MATSYALKNLIFIAVFSLVSEVAFAIRKFFDTYSYEKTPTKLNQMISEIQSKMELYFKR